MPFYRINNMVATDTDTQITSTSLSTTNYFIPSFKMDLPGNLLHPIILWTKDDVQKWIAYCIDEYSLHDINLNDYEMNGKALLLLNEDGFKQRSLRCGDILHRALQQHNALIKTLTCQVLPYQFWNNFGFYPSSPVRHFNIPLPPPPPPPPPMPYIQPTVNYMYHHHHHPERNQQIDFMNSQQSIQTHQISNSFSPSITKSFEQNNFLHSISSIKQECIDQKNNDKIPCQSTLISPQLNESRPIKIRSGLFSKIKQQSNSITDMNDNDTTRKIRYYNDRVDFHGDILMKPQAAKNCRILWEFIYILLEDPYYESIIHWENREKMIFRIVQADKLAALWGLQKNRLSMTYEKLSRGMRYYYSNNIISKEQSKRLLYRFMRSPDEIRKTMKRNVDTTMNTVYSTLNKKPSLSLSSPSPSTSNFHQQESSTETSNRFLQLFSVHSPSYTPIISNLNSINNRLCTTPNNSISKSDRSSSSSPVSFDSNHDNEKQYCSLSQSSSSIIPTKRQTLNTCLSYNYSLDQPLDLVVHKDEKTHFNYKKQKLIYNSSNI
ncbi:unnamed protein product [Rotaria sordida]|uniref:Uncharacterized protein n=2 Tax=Rotaria sordida TaxID=392033 RepID=A0A813RVM8_9BILA|nr:unnamed protein product [Rotaria sordida]CAF1044162.1 unnamed protein product [Rotaria sordida]